MLEETSINDYTACGLEPLLTDLQQAELIRQDQEAAYRIMADAMPQIVWTALSGGYRDYFNQRWYEHTRLSPGQSEGSGWIEALHAEDREKCKTAWEAAVKEQEAFQVEYRLLCSDDNSYRWHMERALPLLDPRCNVVKWFGTCTDIEELKQTRTRNEALIQQLWRAMTETHHRVKNNLQIVATMVELHLLDDAEFVSKEKLHQLNAQIRTIATIHDILTQTTKENVTVQNVSIKDIIDKLLPIYEQTSPDYRISASIADALLPSKQGTALALVINELISNAIKHGHSQVEVIVSIENSRINVTVCDDGVGFPEGFDPQQAANTGLELIATLVRWDLSGEVTFGNQPEGGGQVTLSLPMNAREA